MMLTPDTRQWGSVAFMVGSLLFLVNKLNEMSRLFLSRWMSDVISGEDTWLIILGQVAFIIGYVGYFRLYNGRLGRGGKTALRLFCGGGILLAIGHVSFMRVLGRIDWVESAATRFDPFFLVFIGLALMLIGLIWFGILNLRRPILARWQWLPLATGLMGFIGFFLFSGEAITAVFLLFRTLFALGLLGLGLTMWSEKPAWLEKSVHLEVAS